MLIGFNFANMASVLVFSYDKDNIRGSVCHHPDKKLRTMN